MAATFNPGLVDPKDRIRQRIGDTDVTSAQVQDETIAAYLTTFASHAQKELRVAYQLCLDLAAKWARFGTTTLDDQQQRAEDIYKHYLELAQKLKIELQGGTAGTASTGGIVVGGIGDTRGPIDPWPADHEPFYVGIPITGP